MIIISQIINIQTEKGINIYNVTDRVQDIVTNCGVKQGQVLIFSRHTTTALAINENEERLLIDLKHYLMKLAPQNAKYLHNDLHLRPNIPPDEPINAHSHLMAMTLSTSEIIPVIDAKIALGTYQSILFFDLDGARNRTLLVQVSGIN